MKIIDCLQGSPEWLLTRHGIPTCSAFDQILTPRTRKPAKGTAYRNQLLAEWMLGRPIDWGQTEWTERGHELEPEAVEWYEFQMDVEVERTGFIMRDDGMTGGSPDGLVGDDGGLEVKCRGPKNHMACLLGDDPAPATQVQGYMWITGRQWWDVLGYHPDMPPVLLRVERDEAFIADLSAAVEAFIVELRRCRSIIEAMGAIGRRDSLEALLAASLTEAA